MARGSTDSRAPGPARVAAFESQGDHAARCEDADRPEARGWRPDLCQSDIRLGEESVQLRPPARHRNDEPVPRTLDAGAGISAGPGSLRGGDARALEGVRS